jgi:hypothetical protein
MRTIPLVVLCVLAACSSDGTATTTKDSVPNDDADADVDTDADSDETAETGTPSGGTGG